MFNRKKIAILEANVKQLIEDVADMKYPYKFEVGDNVVAHNFKILCSEFKGVIVKKAHGYNHDYHDRHKGYEIFNGKETLYFREDQVKLAPTAPDQSHQECNTPTI